MGLTNGWSSRAPETPPKIAVCDTPCRALILRQEPGASLEASNPVLMMSVYRLLLQVPETSLQSHANPNPSPSPQTSP